MQRTWRSAVHQEWFAPASDERAFVMVSGGSATVVLRDGTRIIADPAHVAHVRPREAFGIRSASNAAPVITIIFERGTTADCSNGLSLLSFEAMLSLERLRVRFRFTRLVIGANPLRGAG